MMKKSQLPQITTLDPFASEYQVSINSCMDAETLLEVFATSVAARLTRSRQRLESSARMMRA